jgi:hypothetical protein
VNALFTNTFLGLILDRYGDEIDRCAPATSHAHCLVDAACLLSASALPARLGEALVSASRKRCTLTPLIVSALHAACSLACRYRAGEKNERELDEEEGELEAVENE